MALVRRSDAAVGRAGVPGAGAPVGTAPGPGIPLQQAGGQPSPGYEMAAAVPTLPAKAWAVVSGLGMTATGAVGAWGINESMNVSAFQIGDTTSTFGALLVFAGAVERTLEPFSRFMPGRKQQERYERALADMDNGVPGAMNAAAHYKAAVESARAARGVMMWGLATLVATLLSAGSGFYLLRMLSVTPAWDGIAPWADALVTGLVVGSGTKPLHDLITRAQNNRANAH